MSARRQWTFLVCCVLALNLVGFSAAFAQKGGPIITTPTPTPAPTVPVDLGQLTERLFVPWLAGRLSVEGHDVEPNSFAYTVQPGDTLWTLALDFGRDLDTMACATTPLGDDAETLSPGQVIVVPALTDLCYTVTPGDTLDAIAGRFGITNADIRSVPWNGLSGETVRIYPRQRILLPGVRREAAPRANRTSVSWPADDWANSPWPDWPFGDGHFIWPVAGPISQGAHSGHYALDIAVPNGTHVLAADRGKVLMAGWNPSGYGFRVVIDHGNDYVTLYAHLSDIYVEQGQIIGKGQVIGASGANGNVTGPHVHFEIRDFGILTDPLRFLP